ncbi:protein HGV2 isoform X2 [Euwallacea fornicatus]|uniref:protein HGV2 isoform X2 n=1 Tax=Euwallacea fornicatus TaxID=995702 RepID=UPI00338F480C
MSKKMADVSVDPECNDPKELFGQGVRAYILQNYEAAVAALSKASELLVNEHQDDMHESLGEIYLFYGKALLGLSREESEALGDALPKNEESENEEEEEEEGSEDAGETKTEENNVSSSVSGKGEPENGKEETKETENLLSSSSDDPGPSTSKGDGAEPSDDQQESEDVTSDLQVAWEVLEFAKQIFQKLDEKKSLAEALIVLGEVSLESENFESAINDIKQGLELQKGLFAKDSRTVAETLYKLGMAYSTNSQMDEAIQSFTNSLEYLKNRITTLKEIKPPTQEHDDEIEEIQGLIPEIEDKIADMHVYKDEAIKKVTEAITESTKKQEAASSNSNGNARVSDISHLVKRKRKIEEADNGSEGPTPKKPAV